LTALKIEARAIARAFNVPTPRPGEPVTFSHGPIPVELHVIGVGAPRMPADLSPQTTETVIMTGLAGGLDPSLGIGDVVIDDASTWRPPNANFPCLKCHTADQVIGSVEDKSRLFQQTGAAFVDMESAAVREAAARLGIPYLGVRAISDTATDAVDPAVLRLVDPFGNVRVRALAGSLIKSPTLVPRLMELSKASKKALAALSAAVVQLAALSLTGCGVAHERQITTAPHGHILTNTAVWCPDGQWIVYDVRSDHAGSTFDGDRIERVHVDTGRVELLYQAKNNAKCGVVTYHPFEDKVVFILGPENPTPDWQYGPNRRQGVIVDCAKRAVPTNLEARDLTEPFTPGALRGGTHVHVFSPDGRRVSFTYNDALVDPDQRNVGVSLVSNPVAVSKDHPRNHDGSAFSVLVTRTTANPASGSDEIRRAFEDAWVGGGAIAFQGEVITRSGQPISEVFIVELPQNMEQPGDAPLQGTTTRLPAPPRGAVQRRLTFTADRKFPGISGPRHWLRSSPDGRHIAFLMKDDAGITQLFIISPRGGEPIQLTHNPWPIASAFTWSADGRQIAHAMDNSVFVTDTTTGRSTRLTERTTDAESPRPEACVFSPDGTRIACTKTVNGFNQVFVCSAIPLK
jgi:hypothetical protein